MRLLRMKKTKLFTLIALCFFGMNAAFLLASGVLFYSIYTDLAFKEIEAAKSDLLEATSEQLSSYVSGIQDTAIFLVTNEMIREHLAFPPDSFYEFRADTKDIYDQFLKMLSVKPGVHSIELYTDAYRGYTPVHDRFLYPLSKAAEEGWLERFALADGFWLSARAEEDGENEGGEDAELMVSYVHGIIGETGRMLGVVKINIPARELFRVLSKDFPAVGSDDYYVVMDSRGEYIASTLPPGLSYRFDGAAGIEEREHFAAAYREAPTALLKGGDISGRVYNAVFASSGRQDWKLVQLIAKDVFLKNREQIQWLSFALLTALLLLSIPIVLWISKRLTSPIRDIVEGMHAVEKGDFTVRLNGSPVHEVQYLTTHFNRMVGRLGELVWQLNKEHVDRREAELNLLQAQIKPHFLYNTLDLIHWRALDHRAEDISQMVHQLSKLFRIGLSNNKWYVSVKDELVHAQCYLAIQKYRQSFAIRYTERVDKALYGCLIPKIVLQPFLENAVVHGFRSRQDDASIEVTVEAVAASGEEQLWLTIADDGCGLPEAFDARATKGIGIRNVADRIHLYCGLRYGVDIGAREGGGTTVRLRLPLVRSEDEIEKLRRSLTHEDDLACG